MIESLVAGVPVRMAMTLTLAISMANLMQCETAGESTTPWAAGKRSLTKWAARDSGLMLTLCISHLVCPGKTYQTQREHQFGI